MGNLNSEQTKEKNRNKAIVTHKKAEGTWFSTGGDIFITKPYVSGESTFKVDKNGNLQSFHTTIIVPTTLIIPIPIGFVRGSVDFQRNKDNSKSVHVKADANLGPVRVGGIEVDVKADGKNRIKSVEGKVEIAPIKGRLGGGVAGRIYNRGNCSVSAYVNDGLGGLGVDYVRRQNDGIVINEADIWGEIGDRNIISVKERLSVQVTEDKRTGRKSVDINKIDSIWGLGKTIFQYKQSRSNISSKNVEKDYTEVRKQLTDWQKAQIDKQIQRDLDNKHTKAGGNSKPSFPADDETDDWGRDEPPVPDSWRDTPERRAAEAKSNELQAEENNRTVEEERELEKSRSSRNTPSLKDAKEAWDKQYGGKDSPASDSGGNDSGGGNSTPSFPADDETDDWGRDEPPVPDSWRDTPERRATEAKSNELQAEENNRTVEEERELEKSRSSWNTPSLKDAKEAWDRQYGGNDDSKAPDSGGGSSGGGLVGDIGRGIGKAVGDFGKAIGRAIDGVSKGIGRASGGASSGGSGGGGKPIVLDLNGDGVKLVDLRKSNVFFDINGDGYRKNMGWASAKDGFLAIDLGGDKKITDYRELSFTSYKKDAKTDLDGLKAFDSNKDGKLDKKDSQWQKFGVWQDKNQNGITDEGEFKSLAEMGIASIALKTDGKSKQINNNLVFGTGSYTMQDGTKRAFADTALVYSDLGFTYGKDGSAFVRSSSGRVILTVADNSGVSLDLGKRKLAGVIGGRGNDTLKAGTSLDVVLSGQKGNDVLVGSVGDDWLFGGSSADSLKAGPGHDVLFFDAEDLTGGLVDGGAGYDVAYATGDTGVNMDVFKHNIESVVGTKYADTFTTSGLDGYHADGGAGNDSFTGGAGDDMFVGGLGKDSYVGGAGNDVFFIDGDDIDGSNTVINGGSGIDTVVIQDTKGVTFNAYPSYVERVIGGSGDDTLSNDTLSNGNGFTAVTLEGGGGNDTLIGGRGNDVLKGDEGENTYVFSRNFGQDTIINGSAKSDSNKSDTAKNSDSATSGSVASGKVVFKDDITLSELTIERANDDLRLSIAGSDEELTIKNWYKSDKYKVARFEKTGGKNCLPMTQSPLNRAQ